MIFLALLAFSSHTLWAGNKGGSIASSAVQQKKSSVSGAVKDEKGEAIIGASVSVKGMPTIGTVTDIDGKFTLNNVPQNSTLVISFVGMKTLEVAVSGKATIAVVLESSSINMDEVVVVGFGTQKKVNLTGAVSTINAKEIESRPVQNVAQALQGIVPGLNISQNQGSLESRPSINVRGIGTIGDNTSGNPLILVDGMEGDINAINPQDIENISVLKDAASSAVYGSRAPFGVILITTKKGKAGKSTVNYSNNFKWSSPVLLPQMMDSYTFALYFNDAFANAGSTPFFNDSYLQRIKDFQQGKLINPSNGLPMTTIPNGTKWGDYGDANDNIDWYKTLFKSSVPAQEHNVSVSGGNETTNYYISGNFLDQEGFMRFGGDNFNRYTATAKINTKLSKYASIGYSGRWVREDFERPSNAADDGALYQDLARQGWPTLPVYDPNGHLFSAPSPALGLSEGGRDNKQTDWLYQQIQLVLEPINGWKITSQLNYKTIDQFRHWDVQKTYNYDVKGNPYVYGNNNSSVHEEANRTNFLNPNIYSEYSKAINNHNFKVMVGFQSELNKYRDLSADRKGMITPSLPTIGTTDGIDASGKVVAPSVGGKYEEWSTTGFFGRFNYDYSGRYLLEANFRYDGTSRFRSDKRWNMFPSLSLGWNVSKEAFWKPLEAYVNTFKIKASYGSLGNQNTKLTVYPTYLTMNTGASNGSWLVGGIKPNTASAPTQISTGLTWEKIRTWNVGGDLGMFSNRLTSSFDYYIRYTDDMLAAGIELPATFGTGVPPTNNTNLKTSGFEFSMDWKDRLSNGFGYGIRVVVSDARSKVTKYPNPTNQLDRYVQGRTLGEIWGYTTKGIAKSDAEMTAHLASLPNGGQNAIGDSWSAGDIMYVDINGDGKIDKGANTAGDHGDLSVIGNKTPRFPFSVDLSADWKGFDARMFFQGVMKRDYFQDSYFFWGFSGNEWWSTGFVEHEDYFRADSNHPLGQNLDSYYPRPIRWTSKNQQTQSRYLQNAAYVRLKNLQFGYTLPSNITKRIRIQKIRMFISGENLWTYTKLAKMFDPETIDGGKNGNGNAYPLSKVFSCGISVNF